MRRWGPLPRMTLPGATIVASVLAVALPVSAAAGEERSWDRYRVLVERNIFRRDRRRPRGTAPAAQIRLEDSDRSVVLTGVATQSGEFVAFFEDTRTRATVKVRADQAIGKGRLRAITLDGVEYEREGSVRKIEMGRSLAGTAAVVLVSRAVPRQPTRPAPNGGEPTTMPAESTTQPAVTPARTPPSSAGDPDVADILERLRRRREQELRR